MAIWSGKTKKYRVRIHGLRLENLRNLGKERVFAIEVKWERPSSKHGLSSLYRKSHQSAKISDFRVLQLGENCVQFDAADGDYDEGFVNDCDFSMDSRVPSSFDPWFVAFNVLSGEIEEPSFSISSRSKMQVIGKVRLNLGELASKMEAQSEHKIQVPLQMDGVSMEATLKLLVSFTERKNSFHIRTSSDDSIGGPTVRPASSSAIFHQRSKSQQDYSFPSYSDQKPKKSKLRLFGLGSSTRTPTTTTDPPSENEHGTSSSSSFEYTHQPDSSAATKPSFWKWRRLSFKHHHRRAPSLESSPGASSSVGCGWERKEMLSRDGKTRVKAEVLFASYDQRGEEAAGPNACAAIAAVIAHWLQVNPDSLPTSFELDRLITDGSSEWRKLCEVESHKECFPDQRFDLETILGAGLRPLWVHPGDSRFGFFHPEEFEDYLKDATSFDDIWNDLIHNNSNNNINNNNNNNNSNVYIVRWNDHFFVLKVGPNANYIIDSLGERLHEGCRQAYVLKFDDTSVMYATQDGEEKEVVLCRGKECCREYMKRFLAAIQLRELKEEEEKGRKVDAFVVYNKLQIDFHLSSGSSSSSAVSTANTSISNSPNTSFGLLGG